MQTDDSIQPILELVTLFYSSFESQIPYHFSQNNILIGGMGGSAISGEYIKYLARTQNPDLNVQVCRDYTLPVHINSDWLIIIVSYSGYTFETLSLLKQAFSKSMEIIAISSGGTIQEFCQTNNISYFEIPKGYQPRFAFPLIYGKLAKLLFPKLKLSDRKHDNITIDPNFDSNSIITNLMDDKIPIVLTTPRYEHIGTRFRCQLNENSKTFSSSFVLPEFNHNGIVALDSTNGLKFHFVFIYSHSENGDLLSQISFLKKYIPEKGHSFSEINLNHSDLLMESLLLTQQLDLISYKLAIKKNVNPLTVTSIDKLKQYLKDSALE